jgi:hypothetical protein
MLGGAFFVVFFFLLHKNNAQLNKRSTYHYCRVATHMYTFFAVHIYTFFVQMFFLLAPHMYNMILALQCMHTHKHSATDRRRRLAGPSLPRLAGPSQGGAALPNPPSHSPSLFLDFGVVIFLGT